VKPQGLAGYQFLPLFSPSMTRVPVGCHFTARGERACNYPALLVVRSWPPLRAVSLCETHVRMWVDIYLPAGPHLDAARVLRQALADWAPPVARRTA